MSDSLNVKQIAGEHKIGGVVIYLCQSVGPCVCCVYWVVENRKILKRVGG